MISLNLSLILNNLKAFKMFLVNFVTFSHSIIKFHAGLSDDNTKIKSFRLTKEDEKKMYIH